jgi:cell division protein FtsL
MTLPGNGTTKKVIASVLAALCIFLISQVLATSNRVTAVEIEISNLKYSIEQGRADNKDEHKEIKAMLGEIARDIGK